MGGGGRGALRVGSAGSRPAGGPGGKMGPSTGSMEFCMVQMRQKIFGTIW